MKIKKIQKNSFMKVIIKKKKKKKITYKLNK